MTEIIGNPTYRRDFRSSIDLSGVTSNWPTETRRLFDMLNRLAPGGIFATGIENADPWIDETRRNQLEEAFNFKENLETRLGNIRRLGLTWLRFGVGYSIAHRGPDEYDFELTDQVVACCQELGITLILDLLHFGLPEWLHADCPDTPFFQNESFPTYFAEYARAVAKRYPQIRYYTPVNEPLVTARFSAKDGFWNEKIASEWWDHRPFVRATANLARASILAREAINDVWQEEKRPDEPIFFQNESFEGIHAAYGVEQQGWVEGFNLQRFSTTDLMFGHDDPKQKTYLLEQGMTAETYRWFMKKGSKRQTILGIDYYPWNVHRFAAQGKLDPDPFLAEGIHVLVTDYWKRYQMPFFHMEINSTPERAIDICVRTYESLRALREVGYPILGMTWYGDELQVGWQSLMVGPSAFDEYRVGLFYKGKTEPVGSVFAKLARNGFPPILTE